MSQVPSNTREFGAVERLPILPEEWNGLREAISITLGRLSVRLIGLLLIAAAIGTAIAIVTYSPADPSWNNANSLAASNALGLWGANVADLLMQAIGYVSLLAALPPLVWGIWLADGRIGLRLPLRTMSCLFAVAALAIMAAILPSPLSGDIQSGMGGLLGDALLAITATRLDALGIPTPATFSAALAGGLGTMALLWSCGVNPFTLALPPALLSAIARMFDALAERLGAALKAPFQRAMRRERQEPRLVSDFDGQDPDMEEFDDFEDIDQPANPATHASTSMETVARIHRPEPELAIPPKPVQPPARLKLQRNTTFQLPSLNLLEKIKPVQGVRSETDEELAHNGRLLEGILAEFGVRGQVTDVRPGPIVTLYEFEPAAGTRSSKVISLSDDIARSMSVLSARVAPVPGRNILGIELSNKRRENVYLRDILTTEQYANGTEDLLIALGKNIAGEPVVADLARMPHLLIGGTTGSGKSVGMNTMILSVLFRMAPTQCKMIMIDPKCVELSDYNGIPHLLSPVVTEPKKAITALKWVVREMEQRYQRITKLGGKGIKKYNALVMEAKAKGQVLKRSVHVGYSETGTPLHEEEILPLETMPYIIVIIDEMADLMMVAGKEIEAAVQRIAQLGRAAGIHLIAATQRPSVDVITGTIKANFPARISFQVSSKFDSATILGEKGAEYLLGSGDMLFLGGAGRINRVHGAYVDEKDVVAVVEFLKSQGTPSYIDAITEEVDDGEDQPLIGDDQDGTGDSNYDQAVAIVTRERRVSTSYIQRRLRIGYNSAARIVERMEQEGVISGPNHAGKREVLAGDHSGRDD